MVWTEANERDEKRLEGLKAVTDTALAYLDTDELLNELLDRVIDALGADTAAVLLVDDSGTELVARAARGIEEEVRQGVRVPIGAGFAGRIAAERRPIVLDHIDDSTVWNPILWRAGIQAMLGVPLISGTSVIGVLHVGTLGDRTFMPDDAHLLQAAGDRIANAIRLRLLESERVAAEAVQRSLLPSTPPRIGDLEFAARYVPTERGGIGGDWYDVFGVGDTVWVVTGDVAGHGLRAAVVMGRIRSALRAYALLADGPGEVLAMTDRKIEHFEIDEMVTVAVATLQPPYDEIRLALAGHPPPVLADEGATAAFVVVEAGPPLGANVGSHSWPVTAVPLAAGSVVAFYTDGLVERRTEDLGVGLERLRAAVQVGEPARVCHQIMSLVIGDLVPTDDIALLVMRRRAAG